MLLSFWFAAVSQFHVYLGPLQFSLEKGYGPEMVRSYCFSNVVATVFEIHWFKKMKSTLSADFSPSLAVIN